MKPQDFMEALGGVSQEKLDALAKWQEAGTPITGKAPAQEKRIMQTAAEPVPTQRRRETMKQKVKTKASAAQFLPWKFGIGAAVATCAAIAVSIGAGIISMDKQQQMQVGMSGETSVAEQISKQETNAEKTNHEPVPLIDNLCAFSGTDEIAPAISDNGLVEVWRSMNDAAEFIEYDQIGKLTNCSDYFTDALFAKYDVLYAAHPLKKYLPENTLRFQLSGGEFDADGKLHMTIGALALDELPNSWASDAQRLNSVNHYWFYTVPKNSLPEITAWEFEVDEYHVGELDETAKDAAAGDDAIYQFIKTTDAYQKWDAAVNRQLYITWGKSKPVLPEGCEEVQSADAAHEPVEIIEKLISSGGNDSTMMKLPPEGAVQVLRSVEDAEACCRYSSENVAGQPFDFRNKLTEDLFAEYDVLYFAFKDEQKPQYCYSVDLAGGSIAADGSILKLDFHALMFDPAHLPSDWCSVTEPDWNTYYFYTVPKNILPDLNAIELSFEEYPLGEIPDEILAHANDLVDIEDNGYITKHTKLQEYLETTQEYLDWVMSMPKPKYISWEDNTQLP